MLGHIRTYCLFYTLNPYYVAGCLRQMEAEPELNTEKLVSILSDDNYPEQSDRIAIFTLGIIAHQVMANVRSPYAHNLLATAYQWGVLQKDTYRNVLNNALSEGSSRGWSESPGNLTHEHNALEFVLKLMTAARSFAHWRSTHSHDSHVTDAIFAGITAIASARYYEHLLRSGQYEHSADGHLQPRKGYKKPFMKSDPLLQDFHKEVQDELITFISELLHQSESTRKSKAS